MRHRGADPRRRSSPCGRGGRGASDGDDPTTGPTLDQSRWPLTTVGGQTRSATSRSSTDTAVGGESVRHRCPEADSVALDDPKASRIPGSPREQDRLLAAFCGDPSGWRISAPRDRLPIVTVDNRSACAEPGHTRFDSAGHVGPLTTRPPVRRGKQASRRRVLSSCGRPPSGRSHWRPSATPRACGAHRWRAKQALGPAIGQRFPHVSAALDQTAARRRRQHR